MNHKVADLIDSTLMQSRVAYNTTGANILWLELKLWFHEDKHITTRFETRICCGQNFSKRDEGNIAHNKLHFFTEVIRCEIASVELLSHNNARIGAQLPDELIGAHVHGVYAQSTILKQTICEASGGRAYIQAYLA